MFKTVATLDLVYNVWMVEYKEKYAEEDGNTIDFAIPQKWFKGEMLDFLQKDEQVQLFVKNINKSNCGYDQVQALRTYLLSKVKTL
jgi:hypothetical protein